MSHSTTSGGVRRTRARKASGATAPAAPVMPRSVARRSIAVAARRAARVRRTRPFRQRQLEARQHRLHLRQFVGRHRREVLGLQHLARRKRERGVEFDFVLVVGARLRASSAAASPARAAPAGPAARACSPVRPYTRGSSAATIFSSSFGLRQKRSNACSNSDELLVPRHQHRRQRFAKVGLVGHADRLDRGDRVDHLGRPHRQSGRAQHAHEVQHVVGQIAPRQQHRGTGASSSADQSVTALRLHLGDDPCGDLLRDGADVVLVLEQHAERVGDRLRVERDAVERHQRFRPVERLGDARRLEEVHRAQPLRERDDLARQRLRRARDTCGAGSRARAARPDSRPSGRGSGA